MQLLHIISPSYFTRHADRTFVLRKDIRKALINVARGPSSETLEILNNLLDSNAHRYEHLKLLLNWCISTFGFEWPNGVVAFIVAIAKNYPICAIFHADSYLISLWDKLLTGYPIKKHPCISTQLVLNYTSYSSVYFDLELAL